MARKKNYVLAWGWLIKDDHDKWVLCYWADSERGHGGNKPSPEAKRVRVRISLHKTKRRK